MDAFGSSSDQPREAAEKFWAINGAAMEYQPRTPVKFPWNVDKNSDAISVKFWGESIGLLIGYRTHFLR